MRGTVAVTDYGWYLRLSTYPQLDEVNFWKPSSKNRLAAPEFSPFLFKLKAPYSAICGFGYFARYSRLPDWLAWDAFSVGNGCDSLQEMRERVRTIRHRMHYSGALDDPSIGCVIVVQPTFFPQDLWVRQPADWPDRVLSHVAYDLTEAEGVRVWSECLAAAAAIGREQSGATVRSPARVAEESARSAGRLVGTDRPYTARQSITCTSALCARCRGRDSSTRRGESPILLAYRADRR